MFLWEFNTLTKRLADTGTEVKERGDGDLILQRGTEVKVRGDGGLILQRGTTRAIILS